MTYYDRDSDIAYLGVSAGEVAHSVEHEWGLVDLDEQDALVGVELWDATRHLPVTLLAALPQTSKKRTIIQRQPA